MAKEQYVSDLKEDGIVADNLFMVKDIGVKSFSTKEGSFLQLQLMDRTGEITSICWEPELLDFEIKQGQVIKVRGIVRDHKSFGHQMIFKPENASPAQDYELADYLKKTDKDVDEMFGYLMGRIENIENPHLKALALSFFGNQEFASEFKNAPSAKFYHHNFIGGLLEHTVNVVKDCEMLLQQYPMDKDLLITGALLHDIGKIKEYEQKPVIEMTDIGGLAGHIVIGYEMLNLAIAGIEGFPENLKLKLGHILLSHHMKPEFGSPQRPKFIEAFAIAHADFMDAKMQAFRQSMGEVSAEDDDSAWHLSKNLRYYMYLK